MTIRVLVNGARGRMGQITVKMLEDHPDFTLVAQTTRGANLAAIIKAGARPVIGTSGLLPKQVAKLQAQCKKLKLGGVIAPNFSLGMILMMKYAREFVKYFPAVEIIEMHHDRKLDSPSGTAMYTAQTLAAARGKSKTKAKDHQNIPGARGAEYLGIPIHAIRLPGLVAHEQIIFGDLGETLTLRHDSIDRLCFMRGVALACQKVKKLKELVYGLEQII